jgi:hypothetical protein
MITYKKKPQKTNILSNTLKMFKNLLHQNQQANFNETLYKSSLGRIVHTKGQVLFNVDIPVITKMQKWGGII